MPKQFYCLSIETTGTHLGLSLVKFDQEKNKNRLSVLASYFKPEPTKQSQTLLPTLTKLLTKVKLKPSQLNLLSVDVGPGSFTGVRVGVSAARALAQGLKIPLIGISSLEAMAYQASSKKEAVIASYLPALAGETYYAVYKRKPNASLKAIRSPRWVSEDIFKKDLKKMAKSRPVVVNHIPHPKSIAALALEQYAAPKRKHFPYENVVPLYLQPSWAERKNKK